MVVVHRCFFFLNASGILRLRYLFASVVLNFTLVIYAVFGISANDYSIANTHKNIHMGPLGFFFNLDFLSIISWSDTDKVLFHIYITYKLCSTESQ